MKINKIVSKYLNEGSKYKSPLAAFDDDDHSEYMNMILNKQKSKGKVKIKEWDGEPNKDGDWTWTNDDGYKGVFTVSFDNNKKGIEAKGIDGDGKEKKLGTFPLELTGNTMNDFVNYMQVVKKVLNKIK